MMNIRQFPLLAIVLVLYNLIVFTLSNDIGAPFLYFTLFSGAQWSISIGELLVMAGLVCLYLEVIKSTHASRQAALDHALSMIVLVICIVEFVIVRHCGTTTFFIILLMALFDVMGGFQISIASARRDIEIDRVVNTN